MTVREINFDGLIGPTHNYAGLSFGNVASADNAGLVARPRAAALQGLAKMRRLIDLGVLQGFLPPARRPSIPALRAAGFAGLDGEVLAQAAEADPRLFLAAWSASSMWAANAATVIAEADSGDGRVHLVTANLSSMLHRSMEAQDTFRILRTVFADRSRFAVHAPLPAGAWFADEGAANHIRLASSHGEPGVNVFVHGAERGGRFPERQALRASQAAARLAALAPDRTVFALQAAEAVEAGAFHNDVVAVANERLLLSHPQAFSSREAVFAAIRARVPEALIVEVEGVSLADAVLSYVFNSQIVTLPTGGMALVVPAEARDHAPVWAALHRALAQAPVERVEVVDVRESMRNGGGPACLRLRVPVSDAAIAAIALPYLLTPDRLHALERIVERHWPETLAPSDLFDPATLRTVAGAHEALDRFLSV